MKPTVALLLVLVLAAIGPSPAAAVDQAFGTLAEASAVKAPRAVNVEERVRNDRAAFVVRIDVNHPDRLYRDGDSVTARVVSEKDGYLYLLNRLEDGKLVCLLPNKYHQDNRIRARREVIIPADDDDFNLRVGPPFGTEALIALVSLEPLAPSEFGAKSLTEQFPTPVDANALIAKAVRVEEREQPSKWAEHHVVITTVPRQTVPTPQPGKQRLGLFVGVSEQKDSRIPRRPMLRTDVETAFNIMKDHGKLDGGRILTAQDATLANVKEAFAELKQISKPGDELFIFWSGHGGRMADDNGDEKDGLDEFLVPYDAEVGNMDSLLLDDAFGRWIQDFDGRRVVLVLQACHSGGMSEAMKGANLSREYFDFIGGELARTKDVGQKDAAMLCASDSDEVSFNRPEGDMSVMYYYLCKKMLDDPRVTLDKAYDYLKVEVPAYLREHAELYEGQSQTPILVNQFGIIYLRP